MNDYLIQVNQITKSYRSGNALLEVLTGIDFNLNPGELVAIQGPSGSGKSTLLHILGTLDQPTNGEVKVFGEDTTRQSDNLLSNLRCKKIGFIFQFHHLIPELTALENVMLPLLIADHSTSQANQRAMDILSKIGLAERIEHTPNKLSGGERQRVAIARAMANKPPIVLADEPTGNLDHKTGELAMEELIQMVTENQSGLVVVTHNPEIARFCQRILYLDDGILHE
jgi:lipoprotein-releasing system ATP-binding protein